MSELKAGDDTGATVDMDSHLDAAIRELRRVGDTSISPISNDMAQRDDGDLDHDLFDEEPVVAVAALPLIAPEAIPAMEPMPRVFAAGRMVDEPSAPSSDTIDASMTTEVETSEAPLHAEHPHVADPMVIAATPVARNVAAHEIAAHEVPAVEPMAITPKPAAPEPAAPNPVAPPPAVDEPSPPAPEPTEPPDVTPMPRRMFGLRRALEARRQGVPLVDFPELAESARTAESSDGPTSSSPEPEHAPEPRSETQPESEQEPAPQSQIAASAELAAPAMSAPVPEVKPERRGWFGASKQPETPEPPAAKSESVATRVIPIAAAASVAVVAAVASAEVPDTVEPAPKVERRGWFGFRKKAEPPAIAPQLEPEPLVDLTPVREAMRAAAEKRAQELQAGTQAGTQVVAIATSSAEAAQITTNPMPHPSAAGRVGVLLINLGTPEAPTAGAVRNYLREFLADKRVIEKDSFAWQLVLRGIILPWRPRFKARSYRAIWNRVNNESPLKTITRAQATKLGEALAGIDGTAVVDWAMRYGQPAIEQRLKAMMAQGCGRILVVPLYPQYSSATTATACDEVFRVLSRIRNQPAVRFAPAYYAEPVYIEAVANSIKAELATLPFTPEAVVASFHGMPLDYVQKGDPYYDQCVGTARLLRERLGMNEQNFILTFQSRFGRTEWLQPYTIETLRKLAKDGVKNVAVVTPGFSADCLETLEEIAIENAHAFKKKGGKNFAFVPCLNDSERGMSVIWDIATRELKGWV